MRKKNEKEKHEPERGGDWVVSDRDDLKTVEKSFKNLREQTGHSISRENNDRFEI